MVDTPLPSVSDVRAARTRIRGHVHHTPVATSSGIDRELGIHAFFKCENLQKVGAFKARGAVNAVMALDDAVAQKGVVCHSSGNHGQALAYAASIRQIPSVVVMPRRAPAVKRDAVAGYGAEVVLCAHEDRHREAARIVAETGGTLIHPFEHPAVVAGQGTAALELLEDVPDLDAVIAPIGGGGLMSGTALVVRDQLPQAMLIAAEPAAVDDAFRSFQTGRRQPDVVEPDTIADGLLTGLGELAFAILQQGQLKVVLVDEDEIAAAARYHLERMKLVVEPSGATGLAALRHVAADMPDARVGVIISGGNTDFSWLTR
jgi:threonine dehydratase